MIRLKKTEGSDFYDHAKFHVLTSIETDLLEILDETENMEISESDGDSDDYYEDIDETIKVGFD